MSIPTHTEEYTKLTEFLRKAQEAAAMLAHLRRAEGSRKDHAVADGWIAVSELLKRVNYQVTALAQGRLQ